jgi:hypothetical protein
MSHRNPSETRSPPSPSSAASARSSWSLPGGSLRAVTCCRLNTRSPGGSPRARTGRKSAFHLAPDHLRAAVAVLDGVLSPPQSLAFRWGWRRRALLLSDGGRNVFRHVSHHVPAGAQASLSLTAGHADLGRPVGVRSRNFSKKRIESLGHRSRTPLREGIRVLYEWIARQVESVPAGDRAGPMSS